VDEALAAAQHVPDDALFTEGQLAIVNTACVNLGITRPNDSIRAVANAVATALVRARRQ
jgi:hypothetical protein